ncbi:MAG: very short patch repair endonuclease [Nitriliruptorales bacterium]
MSRETVGESWASSAVARATMQANRSRDTKPEMAVRRELHRRGLRYRVHVRPVPDLPRVADVVFGRAKVAVFVDGCYWHGCPQHGSIPKANRTYWTQKIARNQERDRRTDAVLRKAGWEAIRVWEHEEPHRTADLVEAAVRRT